MLEAFAYFRWLDALDILIVAFAIYQLLLLFRGTRAFHMVIGLVFLYLAFRVSLRIGLLTVSWILQNLLGVWFLSIIIVFQPELRRALASVGQRGWLLRAFSGAPEGHTIDEVVRAATSLAAKRIGALIVLERQTPVAESVDLGVVVDALLSRRLLEAIFTPPSPLHDGAVLIQRGRIAAASSFLPISMNPHVGQDLGTRHRAAIGITEETDAVAVAISEETGRISLAVGGEMTRDLDGPGLRQRLLEIFGPGGSLVFRGRAVASATGP